MMEYQIKHMVDRFLGWRLPENFRPDGGIRYEPTYSGASGKQYPHNPTGTNLLDADQATAMVRYMAKDMPRSSFESELCALVATRRAVDGDMSKMLAALRAECAALEHHIAAENAGTKQENT